ncbi:MAG: SGNH/GDSL hydrolase family protein [Akkermansiaceae bacterium]
MMKKMIRMKLGWGLICGLLCTYGAMGQEGLEKDDVVVFLGDSITQEGVRPGSYIDLTGKTIEKVMPELNIELVGAGVSGNKVSNCLRRLDRDVLKKDPDVVVIYIGINDVWHWIHPLIVKRGGKGTSAEDFEMGLKSMIKQINDVGARVILCTPTVIGEKTDGSNEMDKMLGEFAEISRKVSRESGSQLLDLRREFIDYLKEHNPENVEKGILTRDGVHLTDRGNVFLSGLMLDALNVGGGE